MTDTTNTSAAHAAALAMRDAAAALARRLPLYYGSGEPADEDLAQAIEDLPLPDVDTTDWRAEAERLRAERDEAREQVDFVDRHLSIISGVLGSPEPIEIDDIAARLHLLIAERDELAARLAEIERTELVQSPTWLTDERIAQITAQMWGSVDIAPQSAAAFARAIEAWMLHAYQGPAAAPERARAAAEVGDECAGKRDDGTDGGEAMTEFGDKTDLPGVVVRPRVQLTVRA